MHGHNVEKPALLNARKPLALVYFVRSVWRIRNSMKRFEELFAELQHKVRTQEPTSGTAQSVAAGTHAIGKKILEEAGEVWMAAEHESRARCAEEISQLLYHVQVMMVALGLELDDVYKHL